MKTNLHTKEKFTYCQSEIEDGSKCEIQCDHCKEYYKPLEQNQPILSIEDRAEKYASHSLKEDRQKDLSMGFIAGANEMLPIIKELGKALKKAQNKYVNPKRVLMGGNIENADYVEFQTTLNKYRQYL